jgi:hypothetical protein
MDSQLYHPLKSSRSIRLLHIDDGHRDDPIRASFEEVELDTSLRYHALSYKWGSGEAVESIHIQDNVLSVLPHLFDALKSYERTNTHPSGLIVFAHKPIDTEQNTAET